MKIKNILSILFFLVSFSFYAQNGNLDEKREKIKEYKVAFLTTELELTSAEAEKFWPIYNAYDDKQFELRHDKMKTYLRKLNDDTINSISEKEATTLLSQIESTDKELYLLKEKYIQSLKKILSAKKILKLKKSEDDFNRKLLKQYRDKAGKN
ncbi:MULTISPECIES: sensor of ECF-type sigma factor [Flavobacterium]|uniref:Sensor of ECF-type sigma factor n=2 Tax=Flavobacterium TaxID=237 RepID=A0A941B3B7_9FLAO|nr:MULTISPECIES: sensor of ECF-type sigma factor [Flavobacterium]MBP4138343.1 sensor of ECF-type sigma factor [Flavobacterium geliluteum]MDX6184022.1 sensor of ECF-type sigma factor [Flavobacterium sp. Fl-33]MDX6187575.1 sensor of ECF-type sigma factor [Flavobacterium sp. Fl-77]UFH38467.1 sensor of ECF-type sigma factor [Flavobacterium sp. F-70]